MTGVIQSRRLENIPFCEREILRYAGVKNADDSTLSLMRECIGEAKEVLDYRVCFGIFPLEVKDGVCDLDAFRFLSHDLSKTLKECRSAVLFAATLGVGVDRMIAKYGKISPSKALMFQAIGTERIEALCDAFCLDMEQEENLFLTPRFSPGYGDFSLLAQKDIFSVLDLPRKIGLTLSDALLMAPSKSVTAIAGIGAKKKNNRKTSTAPATCMDALRGNT